MTAIVKVFIRWDYFGMGGDVNSPQRSGRRGEITDAPVGQADVRRQLVEFEEVGMRPGDGARFVRETMIVRFGAEVEDQVMMQMIGLAFVGRYAVNVDADEGGRLSRRRTPVSSITSRRAVSESS